MNQRLRKARRLLALQTERDRLAEWKLSDLQRQDAALQERRRDLHRFLDGESAFAGLFAATMMRRLQSLEALGADLVAEKQVQADRRLEERGRMRCAEQIVDGLESEVRRNEEKRLLAEAIEITLRRDP